MGVTTNVASERPFHGFVLNAGSQMSVTNHFPGEFPGRIGWAPVDRDPSIDLEPGRINSGGAVDDYEFNTLDFARRSDRQYITMHVQMEGNPTNLTSGKELDFLRALAWK